MEENEEKTLSKKELKLKAQEMKLEEKQRKMQEKGKVTCSGRGLPGRRIISL